MAGGPARLADSLRRVPASSASRTDTYTQYPALTDLPALVRTQRRLEAKLAPLEQLAADEKAVRAEIDALLVAAGLAKGEGVTCAGYEVVHHERLGNQFISRERLLLNGVDAAVIDNSLDRHKASQFATVKPMKGAKVRAA